MISIKEQIDEIYLLSKICKQYEHGIKGDNWNIYKPSRFVYAYFTFNNFYSIDWEQSIYKNIAETWIEDKYEMVKVEDVLTYFYNVLKEKAKSDFIKSLNNYLPGKPQWCLKELHKIIRDNNTERYRQDFITAFREINSGHFQADRIVDGLMKMIKFIYKVRCNIFHGNKTTINMQDKNQQNRLEIYTAILLATIDLLFKTAITKIGWVKPEVEGQII